jgi:hypothetical protein
MKRKTKQTEKERQSCNEFLFFSSPFLLPLREGFKNESERRKKKTNAETMMSDFYPQDSREQETRLSTTHTLSHTV